MFHPDLNELHAVASAAPWPNGAALWKKTHSKTQTRPHHGRASLCMPGGAWMTEGRPGLETNTSLLKLRAVDHAMNTIGTGISNLSKNIQQIRILHDGFGSSLDL